MSGKDSYTSISVIVNFSGKESQIKRKCTSQAVYKLLNNRDEENELATILNAPLASTLAATILTFDHNLFQRYPLK